MDTFFIIKYKNIVDIWWTPVFSEQLKKWGYPQKFYPGEYPRFFWTTEIVGATPIFAILLLFLFGDFRVLSVINYPIIVWGLNNLHFYINHALKIYIKYLVS